MRMRIDDVITIDNPAPADVTAAMTQGANRICLELPDGLVQCRRMDTGEMFLEQRTRTAYRTTGALLHEDCIHILQQVVAANPAWMHHTAWQEPLQWSSKSCGPLLLLFICVVVACALWINLMPRLLYFNPVCQTYADGQGWTDDAFYSPASSSRWSGKKWPATCVGEYMETVPFDTVVASVQPAWPARLLFEFHLFEVISFLLGGVLALRWAGKAPKNPPGPTRSP